MTEATIDELEFWIKQCESMVDDCDRVARRKPRSLESKLAKAKREAYAHIAQRMRETVGCAKQNAAEGRIGLGRVNQEPTGER